MASEKFVIKPNPQTERYMACMRKMSPARFNTAKNRALNRVARDSRVEIERLVMAKTGLPKKAFKEDRRRSGEGNRTIRFEAKKDGATKTRPARIHLMRWAIPAARLVTHGKLLSALMAQKNFGGGKRKGRRAAHIGKNLGKTNWPSNRAFVAGVPAGGNAGPAVHVGIYTRIPKTRRKKVSRSEANARGWKGRKTARPMAELLIPIGRITRDIAEKVIAKHMGGRGGGLSATQSKFQEEFDRQLGIQMKCALPNKPNDKTK